MIENLRNMLHSSLFYGNSVRPSCFLTFSYVARLDLALKTHRFYMPRSGVINLFNTVAQKTSNAIVVAQCVQSPLSFRTQIYKIVSKLYCC